MVGTLCQGAHLIQFCIHSPGITLKEALDKLDIHRQCCQGLSRTIVQITGQLVAYGLFLGDELIPLLFQVEDELCIV